MQSQCLWVLCAVLLLMAVQCMDESFPVRRLALCTVVDPHDEVIVRDALTLFRSLYLFGGTLRLATAVIGWPVGDEVDSPSASAMTIGSLVQELHRYHDHITVVPFLRLNDGHAATMNKFQLLRLGRDLPFDYFLWMDADTFVFEDPVPLLPLHRHSGEIHCVAEFYSYMRRYPHINESDWFWNNILPEFVLLGENEVSPNGLCNTGLLLLDRVSVQQVVRGLEEAQRHVPARYHRDRFVDSLYFVYAVNTQRISVSLMPYALNYMAFFEGEIMQLTHNERPVIGHFLSNTEFFCLSDSGDCRCVYHNENILEGSPLATRLRAMSKNATECNFLATGRPGDSPSLPSPLNRDPCTLLWPPEKLDVIATDSIALSVWMRCEVDVRWNMTVRPASPNASDAPNESTVIEVKAGEDFFADIDIQLDSVVSVLQWAVGFSDPHGNTKESIVTAKPIQSLRNGQWKYSMNPMLGTLPVSLSSQMMLWEFALVHDLHSYVNVIICCRSVKGLQSAEEIVRRTKGLSHIVLVNSITAAYIAALENACQSTGSQRCLFWSGEVGLELTTIVRTIPNESCGVVFADHQMNSFDGAVALLSILYQKLRLGGVMMGTQYSLSSCLGGRLTRASAQDRRLDVHAYATQKFARAVNQLLLFTFLEASPVYCQRPGLPECLPAWYIQKQ